MKSMTDPGDSTRHVLVVRQGVGANCSSIGSAVEMLFLSAAAGAAVLAAVSAAMPPVDEATPPTDDTSPTDDTPPTDEHPPGTPEPSP